MNIAQSIEIEKRMHYISAMRPILNKRALFSDTTSSFVTPTEPNPGDFLSIRFRTGKNNVDLVNIIIKGEAITMKKCDSDDYFDFYQCELTMPEETLEYYFEIKVGKICFFYNARGITKELQDYYMFRIIPGFHVPKWAKGAVMYQIYVDRFYNGDTTNDVESHEYMYLGDYSQKVTDWNKYPAQMGVREFYGGDLQGVLDKMDYLESLGIDVIYFNPLFVSPSNHKYDIQDYDNIDPHIGKIVDDRGELLREDQRENRFASKYINRVANKANLDASNQLFAKVVEEAHKRGIRVILDGVFNHCGSFNKWLDRERIYEEQEGYEKGAYVSKDSPYHDYFHFYQDQWPYNYTYDGWWGHETLPKLNYEGSKELYEYILYIGKKWVSPPYNADGWRLDVAADLGHSPEFNHQFWKDFRKAVKEANPNAIIIAEHYGTPREWLKGDEWDTVMNYDAFMEPITWFLTGMQKHSDDYREDLLGNAGAFWGAMEHHGTNFTWPSLQVAMNELSNHDHSRFLTRTNRMVGRTTTLGPDAAGNGINKGVFREAVTIQMSWPGAPTVYYADEAGQIGWTDPDNRRTYPWGQEDRSLIDLHRDLIRLRKKITVLKDGSLKQLLAEYGRIAYARFDDTERCIIAVNNTGDWANLRLFVRDAGAKEGEAYYRRIQTIQDGHTTEQEKTGTVSEGFLSFDLAPFSSVILSNIEGEESEDETDSSLRSEYHG